MLTRAKLLRMPAKKYMAKEQLEFFQTQLTDQKTEALKEIEDARNRLRVPHECKDEADRASFEMDSQLYLRIVDRKSKLVKKIDFALRRIKTGEYGYCMETGEPIGIQRLLIRPTGIHWLSRVNSTRLCSTLCYGANRYVLRKDYTNYAAIIYRFP